MRALAFASVALAACVAPDTTIDQRFDVCAAIEVAAPDASVAQRDAIERGLAAWRARGVRDLRLTDAAALVVRFDDGAAGFHGVYDDEAAVIYLNRALAIDALSIVVSHELGHAFGLAHVATATRASVMNPGNLQLAPTADDALALTALWGSCPAAPASPETPEGPALQRSP